MRHQLTLFLLGSVVEEGTSLGMNPYYIKPAFQIDQFDNLPYLYLDNPGEYSNANPLEKCF